MEIKQLIKQLVESLSLPWLHDSVSLSMPDLMMAWAKQLPGNYENGRYRVLNGQVLARSDIGPLLTRQVNNSVWLHGHLDEGCDSLGPEVLRIQQECLAMLREAPVVLPVYSQKQNRAMRGLRRDYESRAASAFNRIKLGGEPGELAIADTSFRYYINLSYIAGRLYGLKTSMAKPHEMVEYLNQPACHTYQGEGWKGNPLFPRTPAWGQWGSYLELVRGTSILASSGGSRYPAGMVTDLLKLRDGVQEYVPLSPVVDGLWCATISRVGRITPEGVAVGVEYFSWKNIEAIEQGRLEHAEYNKRSLSYIPGGHPVEAGEAGEAATPPGSAAPDPDGQVPRGGLCNGRLI